MRKRCLFALVFGLLLSFSGYAQSDSGAQSESKGSFFLSGGIYNGFFSDENPLVPIPNFEIRKLFAAMVSGNYELSFGAGKTAFGLEAGFSSGSRFGGKGGVDFIPFDLNVAYAFPLAKNFYIGPKLKIGGLGLLANDWSDVVLVAGARLEAELRSTGFPFGLFVSGGIDIFPFAPQFATLPVIEAGLRFPRGKLKKSSSPASAKSKEPAGTGNGGVAIGGVAIGGAAIGGAAAGTGTGASVTQGQGTTAGSGAGAGAAGTGGTATGAAGAGATGTTQGQGTGNGGATAGATGTTQGQGIGTGGTAAGAAGAGATGTTQGQSTGTGGATGTTQGQGTGTGGVAAGAGTSATPSQGTGTGGATGTTQGQGTGTGGAAIGDAAIGGAAAATAGSGLPNTAQGQNRNIILEDGKPGILNSIYFEPDTAVLIESYRPILESVGRQLAADPSLKLLIRAYAANFGTADGRYMVSVSRARFSRDLFTSQYGISASRLSFEAYGADKSPIYATDDWQSHRCVELILFRD